MSFMNIIYFVQSSNHIYQKKIHYYHVLILNDFFIFHKSQSRGSFQKIYLFSNIWKKVTYILLVKFLSKD